MLVRELMTASVVTIEQHASTQAALRLLSEHRLTALPVVDAAGLLVGVVSEADLLRSRVRPDPRAQLRLAADAHSSGEDDGLMSRMSQPIVAAPETDVHDVVQTMLSAGIKSVPVVEAGRVVGMISRSDVVHLMARSDTEIRGEVRTLLLSAGFDVGVDATDGVVAVALAEASDDAQVVRAIASAVAGVLDVRFTS